ncbi:MAG: nitronate monooxygenase, partial [Candidatus Hydrogenedentes bacterium]|nr:nitronate monooxygenase [Candidatus Hydrogenedentota bacterium]
MLKTALTDLLGIKYPIIQAGMGPFSNNKLCIATANAGVLGLLSTSGLGSDVSQPGIYKHFVETGGASIDDDKATVLKKVLKQTSESTKASGGIFGINVMVSAESKEFADFIISTAIQAREEDPDMKERFRVIFTSAGDPTGWGDKIKDAGFKWLHIVPSVKTALRCKKAGVDLVIASGHEGGMHTHWEPIHSMILLPAVVEALADTDIPVVGAGGFCDGQTLAAALAAQPGDETFLVVTFYNPFDGTGSPLDPITDLALLGADLVIDCGALGNPANTGLNDLIACIGAGAGAEVVDIQPLFDDIALDLTHIGEGDIHPNDQGHKAIGKALTEAAKTD